MCFISFYFLEIDFKLSNRFLHNVLKCNEKAFFFFWIYFTGTQHQKSKDVGLTTKKWSVTCLGHHISIYCADGSNIIIHGFNSQLKILP